MRKIKYIFSVLILAIAINLVIVPWQTADAGVASFKTDLQTAFTNNFTAGQRQTIANSFVSAYQSEWNTRVASGTVDNATNRGSFALDKIIAHLQEVVRSEQKKAAIAAVPNPTPLPE